MLKFSENYLNIDLQITLFFKNKHFELCCFVMYRVRGGQHGAGGGQHGAGSELYITRERGGDQRVKESKWKMRRTGGGGGGGGAAQRLHYALGSHLIYKFTTFVCPSDTTILHFNSPAEPAFVGLCMF